MILITGGAGYIGSHTNKLLTQKQYETVVFDNLENGHKEFLRWGEFVLGDLSNFEQINEVFKKYEIDCVIHFAAYAYVGESVTDPAKYYRNNVCNSLNLLDAMRINGVKNIVFSSSCATYGVPERTPITEDMYQYPINPYGTTKLTVERILSDYSKAYDIKFVALRYFNAAGADPDGEIGEWHQPETHLIPIILDAACGNRSHIGIFGDDYNTPDGTCIRDYIHVCDLADAHVKALEYLRTTGHSDYFNLGNGKGNSVKEVINSVEQVTGKKIEIIVYERRIGDPPILTGNYDKALTILGWKPQYQSINKIVSDAWNWHMLKFQAKCVNDLCGS